MSEGTARGLPDCEQCTPLPLLQPPPESLIETAVSDSALHSASSRDFIQ